MLTTVQRFAVQSYLSYRGLFLWLTPVSYTSNVVLRPVLAVMMFGFLAQYALDQETARGYAVGLAGYSVGRIIAGGVMQSLYRDAAFGTLAAVYASPVNRAMLYFSRCVLHVPNAAFVAASVLISAALFLGLGFGQVDWGGTIAAFAAVTFSTMLFSLFVATLILLSGTGWANWIIILDGLLLSLTGVIIPVSELPPVLFELGQLLPVTHGLDGLREAFAGEPGYWPDLAREAGLGLAYGVVGLLLFRLAEVQARRRGVLARVG
jgi:ABC-type polysaccharide/polyol phosphate export permease